MHTDCMDKGDIGASSFTELLSHIGNTLVEGISRCGWRMRVHDSFEPSGEIDWSLGWRINESRSTTMVYRRELSCRKDPSSAAWVIPSQGGKRTLNVMDVDLNFRCSDEGKHAFSEDINESIMVNVHCKTYNR